MHTCFITPSWIPGIEFCLSQGLCQSFQQQLDGQCPWYLVWADPWSLLEKGCPFPSWLQTACLFFPRIPFEPALFARGGWYSCFQWHPSRWPTSGPATIHRLRADGSCVTPIVHLMMAYANVYAWYIAIDENWGLDLWTTNFPLFNSAASRGCSFSSLMYQACIFASFFFQFNILGSAYLSDELEAIVHIVVCKKMENQL